MLEGIDSVDWASVEHTFGVATDVPDLIRGLASEDLKVRDHSIYELYGNIWHQGTIYPATLAAIPFLFELFDAPELPDPINVALLLADIASGDGHFYRPELVQDRPLDAILVSGETVKDAIAREREYVEACRRLISLRLRDFLPYLSHREADVRISVADALSCYPEHADWAKPAIKEVLAVEEDEHVRESLIEYLARMRS